jgi:hypothetical protein
MPPKDLPYRPNPSSNKGFGKSAPPGYGSNDPSKGGENRPPGKVPSKAPIPQVPEAPTEKRYLEIRASHRTISFDKFKNDTPTIIAEKIGLILQGIRFTSDQLQQTCNIFLRGQFDRKKTEEAEDCVQSIIMQASLVCANPLAEVRRHLENPKTLGKIKGLKFLPVLLKKCDDSITETMSKVINIVYRLKVHYGWDVSTIDQIMKASKFPTRPPRELLLLLAARRLGMPTDKLIRNIAAIHPNNETGIMDLFGLNFTYKSRPEGVTGDSRWKTAGVSAMYFVCMHIAANGNDRIWIVGSTMPVCPGYDHAEHLSYDARAHRIGAEHIQKMERSLDRLLEHKKAVTEALNLGGEPLEQLNFDDKLRINTRVQQTFQDSLVGRSMDVGFAFNYDLKLKPCCYRCQCLFRYRQLHAGQFDSRYTNHHTQRVMK